MQAAPAPRPTAQWAALTAVLLAAAVAWVAIPIAPAPGDAQLEAAVPRAIASRLLRFEDLPDGRIRVTDASTGRAVQMIEGEAGFARGTLRSLMRERRRRETSPTLPFALQASDNGHLTLSDPSTGQHIELDAFGPTNAAVFARMLQLPGETP